MYKKYFKRLLDLFFAIILFILTLPIVGVASLIIFILDKGKSPLFKQQRVGKDEVKFNIYKLRTMAKDENGVNQVTKFGKILRDTSIDELPQLINIIKGEMSFIGPRPWISEYSKYFTKKDRRRAEVLPGLSGWAQVQGRNGITVKEKLRADTWYVDHVTFKTDLTILLKTIELIFKRTGASITETGIQDELSELRESYYNNMEESLRNQKDQTITEKIG